MYKFTSKVLIIGLLMSFGISSIALADVPDPFGRPRPINRAEPFSYGFTKIAYKNNYSNDKLAIEYEYYAPKMSDISYTVVNKDGILVSKGVEFSQEGKGVLRVIIPKPETEIKQFVTVKTKCQLNNIRTNFGYKKTDYPIFEDVIDFTYTLVRGNNGYVDIEDNL